MDKINADKPLYVSRYDIVYGVLKFILPGNFVRYFIAMSKPHTNAEDTGLRVTPQGTFYVDRKVFYAREGVRKILKEMADSQAYPNLPPKAK